MNIRWNGWFIMMVMEVPAVFGHDNCCSLEAPNALGAYVYLCDVQSENVHLLDGNVYDMLLLSIWLSAQNTWYSSWTIVPRGPSPRHSVWRWLMNIHVLFVHFMHWFRYCQLIDHYDTPTAEPWYTIHESEGPRGTIVHDEYHVFWALSQTERSSMSYTFPSNKWTFSLCTSHKQNHKYTYAPSRANVCILSRPAQCSKPCMRMCIVCVAMVNEFRSVWQIIIFSIEISGDLRHCYLYWFNLRQCKSAHIIPFQNAESELSSYLRFMI